MSYAVGGDDGESGDGVWLSMTFGSGRLPVCGDYSNDMVGQVD